MTALHDRLDFFLATDALKETQRASWTWSAPRRETVAEHVWHCTLLAMLFPDAAPEGTNLNHVRDLLTIHDLVEVFAGDTDHLSDVAASEVASRELLAGERLIAMLPEPQQTRFDPLWREFQAQETVEARFARAIDALHPMVMAWYPVSQELPTTALTASSILGWKRPLIEPFPYLWEQALCLVQHAVDHQQIVGDAMAPGNDVLARQSDRFPFFVATDALKETRRANWISSSPRTETVAEHCWHVMLLAMLLEDAAPDGTDHDRVRDLLTVHDLVEVYAGDTVLWDDVPLADVDAREQAAGERLVAMLPDGPRQRLDPLWREFQAQETIEARFARAIDALHPLIMAWAPASHGHQNTALRPARILNRKQPFLEAFPPLWELAQSLVQGAVDRGLLQPDEITARQETHHDGRN